MAVRFDADTEDYTRAISLGTITQFSVSCWVKLSADRDTYSTAWCIDSAFTSDYSYLQTTTDGTAMAFYQDGASALGPRALTVGTWYWWGVAVNGVNVTVMSRAADDTTAIVSTSGVGSSNINALNLRLGESVFGGEWLNGCLAAVKVWSGVTLTQAELEAETFRYMPARTAGLLGWYPMLKPDTVDYSGAGSTLSGGTGATVEDGPPISWGPRRHTIRIPAVTPAVGTLAATLPALTATLSGTVRTAGQISATLPTLTAAATGTVKTSGLLAAALPPLTATLSGNVAGNILDATLPAFTVSLAGTVGVTGALNAALPPLGAAIGVEVEIPTNDITVTAGEPKRGWGAGQPESAWSANDATGAWKSGPLSRTWSAAEPVPAWGAGPPTT